MCETQSANCNKDKNQKRKPNLKYSNRRRDYQMRRDQRCTLSADTDHILILLVMLIGLHAVEDTEMYTVECTPERTPECTPECTPDCTWMFLVDSLQTLYISYPYILSSSKSRFGDSGENSYKMIFDQQRGATTVQEAHR